MSDFGKMLNGDYRLVNLQIVYYMPDHNSILQEFVWQTLDQVPKYPRVYTLLDFWKQEIEAVIESIRVCHSDPLLTNTYSTEINLPNLFDKKQ